MDRSPSPVDDTRLSEATVQEEVPRLANTTPLISPRPAPKLKITPLHGLWALTKRDLKKWFTNPYQLLITLIQPAVWLGLFGKALNFGSSIFTTGPSPAATNK